MAKTVYVETTIPNAYASGRNDAASVYRRDITRQWWAEQARFYELRTSEATLAELKAGSYPGQQQAIELVESLPLLDITDEVYAIAELYVRHQLMPAPAAGDALHLALAGLNEIDYLLTWNVRHLANPNKVEHMTIINRRLGLLSPVVISPEGLWIEDV
ncbi:MAG: type II toxin-antitoxin system VapC family toxin [Planctomycetota bacterium]|jgi:predicted nucleic acid-binding protein